jgi:hypothetical protein
MLASSQCLHETGKDIIKCPFPRRRRLAAPLRMSLGVIAATLMSIMAAGAGDDTRIGGF